jgi:hypothetical protein
MAQVYAKRNLSTGLGPKSEITWRQCRVSLLRREGQLAAYERYFQFGTA